MKKYVKAAVESTNESLPKNMSDIYGIIENHRGKFKPDDSYAIEAAILRICDKLDKFAKGQSDAASKCEKSLAKIQAAISDLPAAFIDTYTRLFKERSNLEK